MYSYDAQFLSYVMRASRRSAVRLVGILREALPINSVLDVGCASGTWLNVWRSTGVSDVHGIDGDYIDREQLEIPQSDFTSADLSQPISLGRTFDLVQSLEVGEHIPPATSKLFVSQIVKHSNGFVLFSAAPPGQGGEHHVNERPYEFWRSLFRDHSFLPFDYVRPLVLTDKSICFWYRFNTLLYVRKDRIADLNPLVQEVQIQDGSPISDLSTLTFRIRRELVRRLPHQVQHELARIKARIFPGWLF